MPSRRPESRYKTPCAGCYRDTSLDITCSRSLLLPLGCRIGAHIYPAVSAVHTTSVQPEILSSNSYIMMSNTAAPSPITVSRTLAPRRRELVLLAVLLLPHLFLVSAAAARQCFWPGQAPEDAECLSWRVMVEANNARGWRTVPDQCVGYVRGYMTRGQYLRDLAGVMEQASTYVDQLAADADADGLDAWVFDIDDTCLSNLLYYEGKKFGAYDPSAFKAWASKEACPGIPPVLGLFATLLGKGFKVFLLSGRDEEALGACTAANLEAEGFSGYERLIMRSPEHRGQSSSVFKSAMRKQLVEEGYRIRGNVGDQWSDLQGDCVGDRVFKIPNPMYFVP